MAYKDSKTSLPPVGWRVEMLGIIATVEFTSPGCTLIWSDGQWMIGAGGKFKEAPAVPLAKSMKEARSIGCHWLGTLEGKQLPEAAAL